MVRRLACLAMLLLFVPLSVIAQNCDEVLLATRSFDRSTLTLSERYHLLNSLDTSAQGGNLDNDLTKLGPLLFSRTHLDAEKKEAAQRMEVSYNRDESFEIVKLTSPPAAIDAWLKCKQSRDTADFEVIVFGEPSATEFEAFLVWEPPCNQSDGRLKNIKTQSANVVLGGRREILPGKTPIRVKRERNDQPIDASIEGTFANRSFAAKVRIPAFKRICPTTAEKQCTGRAIYAGATLTNNPECAEVKVAQKAANAGANQSYSVTIDVLGRQKECVPADGAKQAAGLTCSVDVDGKRWTAKLGEMVKQFPYDAYITVTLDCDPPTTK